MASPIIAAIRQRRDLKESVLHTAQELAHRASIYGVVPATSYKYLAEKCHCSPRTAIRHVKRLEEDAKVIEGIRQKRIVRRKDLPLTDRAYTDDPRHAHERVIRNEINQYRFVIQWDKSPQRSSSSSRPCDKTARKFPPPEREKEGSLREKIENQRTFLRIVNPPPGSLQWNIAHETIAEFEALLTARG